jgi:RNA polymerase sigma-70 factor (ECF subfamily)
LSDGTPQASLEAVFRRERGRLVALLTRRHGLDHLADAEDAVQGAMLAALRRWPFDGVPANPAGWLHRVATRLLIDHLRHVAPLLDGDVAADLIEALPDAPDAAAAQFSAEIGDDELQLLFALCHPALPLESQLALSLHSLGPLGLRELAAALFTTESALAQRLARARRALIDAGVSIELPSSADLLARRRAVLAALYVMFGEGYQSAAGERYQREELCEEALRLARGLADHPLLGDGEADALVALMLLQSARLATRLPADGRPLLLHEQDRSQWDAGRIALAHRYLERAQRATQLSSLHLQAAIAAEHATAASFAMTRWPRILGWYELLLQIDAAPPVRLGHAIATAEVQGAAAGLGLLDAMLVERGPTASMPAAPFLQAARAELLARLGQVEAACAACDAALAAARSDAERDLLRRRRAGLVISHPDRDAGLDAR